MESVGLPNGDIAETLTENTEITNKDTEKEESEMSVKKEDGKSEDVNGDDIILIQDTGFTIQISVPGVEPFELLVSSMELVQEIYQVLIDREDTCHRTCFTLQLDGATLDNFAELKNIEGLKDGSVIKVVEEPYTVREARIHTRHVRDLLKSLDNIDGYNGVDCSSLSFLNAVTGGDLLEKKRGKVEQIDCTPPDYIMPGSKDCPIAPLHPVNKDLKAPQCLKSICYSGWNPPPGNRKMHGDLLYLYIETLEEKRYHVTASTKGFYLNQSTLSEFIPKPSNPEYLSHSLIDLLNQISPTFKRNFVVLLQKRTQMHPFERVATPYQVHSWLAPIVPHNVDTIRAEDAFSARLGYEEHIPGQTRDWNEELQTTRELPRKTLPERLLRERAVFKVHSDFVIAATRGAIAVIDGNIMAINPGEEAKMQMFLWNNIFFSLGFDVKDHYKDFGGDAAAYIAPNSDLQGVKAYLSVDTEGLYTLGTIVVDYRGYRVTAQSIIPGILEREQEQSVVYGSIDFGKTVVSNDKYKEVLQKTASQLKIRPHKVINNKEEEVELYSSVECKGIVGNDNRYYVLDLLRTFPPDVNYMDVCKEEMSEELKKHGFPRKFKHRLVCLRQELVDAFVESKYVTFVKHAAYQFQQLRIKKLQLGEKENENKAIADEQPKEEDGIKDGEKESNKSEEKEKDENTKKLETTEDEVATEEAKRLVEELAGSSSNIFEENSRAIVKKACQAVGSLSDTEFTISFNTDVFQPHVRHADPQGQTLKREEQLVRDAAEFLLFHQIPIFINYCLEHTSSPIDGYTLAEALHHNGINIRYLGSVTQTIEKTTQLSYLYSICVAELITRAAKHLFRNYIQSVDLMNLSGAISHFLNCFLGSFSNPRGQVRHGNFPSKSSKKKNNRKNKMIYLNLDNTTWTTQTPKALWKSLVEDIAEYYYFQLDSDSIDQACDKYSLQKVSLVRSFCKKVGLQLLLKDYNLYDRHHSTFTEEDILNVFPVVKHIHPRASDAYNVFTTGQTKIQQGLLRDGYELISEALNLLNNVYGAMHPEIAACARLLARLNYIMGDYTEALVFQQRAVLMSERVLGIDHPNTITEYAHMALYCFANNQMSNALKLLYRARYLALVCHGENHPEIALFDSNIGLILQGVGEFDLSLKFLQKALELNTKFFGSKSLKVAMSHHLVARTYSCKGEFRAALQNEKQAYTIYKTQLGEEHDRAKESSECLKHLTQQAVKFQKTMNNIYKGEKNIRIPPIQIQTPSIANVLEILNLINGIVFVHISQEEINKFREEMMRRQTSGVATTTPSPQKCLENKGSKVLPDLPKEHKNDSPSEEGSDKEDLLKNVNDICASNGIIQGER